MTFDELQASDFVEHHRCGACGAAVGYQIHPFFAAAVFNSGCNCGTASDTFRLLTLDELAALPSPAKPLEAISDAQST